MNAMRAPSLQERLLNLLMARASVPAKELFGCFPQHDRGGIDAAIGVLMKGGKLLLTMGQYSLTDLGRKNPTPIEPPPEPRINWPDGKSLLPPEREAAKPPPPVKLERRRDALAAPSVAIAESPAAVRMRKCRGKCAQTKQLERDFAKNPSCPDGRDTTCKQCRMDRKHDLQAERKEAARRGPERGSSNAARDASAAGSPQGETTSPGPDLETPADVDDALVRLPEGARFSELERGGPRAEPPAAPEVSILVRQDAVDSSLKPTSTQSASVNVLAHARERRKHILTQLKVLADELEQLDRFEDLCRKFRVDEEGQGA